MNKINIQNPIAVANFVIETANEENNPVTNLKLQKVLFFLQGYCLDKYNTPLIEGDFAKWQYGPVEEDVYREFKTLGSSLLTSPSITLKRTLDGTITLEKKRIDLESNILAELKNVVKKIISKQAWELVELTHNHASWNGFKNDIFQRNVQDYSYEEIKECFSDNMTELGIDDE